MFKELVIAFFFILDYSDAFPDKSCKIPNANGGICTPVSRCDPLNELHLKKSKSPDEDTYFRQSVASCGSKGSNIEVCCPPVSEWLNITINPIQFPKPATTTAQDEDQVVAGSDYSEQTDAPNDQLDFYSNIKAFGQTLDTCGNHSTAGRIVGGNATGYDEYPWLALLEYGPMKYYCGGSVISRSHVLTAAHCLYNPPSKVRLSEYNLLMNPDEVELDGNGREYISVVIVDVGDTFLHMDHVFKTDLNDIGIIKLKHAVEFGRFIQPICLPTMDYISTVFTKDTKFIAAGWGSDNEYVNTQVKKSVYLPYVPFDECIDILEDSDLVKDQHLCAGGESGKDSCVGDSGGPLMYKDPSTKKFVIAGVVSNGAVACGTEDHPGTYMNAYYYVDWIYSIMIEH